MHKRLLLIGLIAMSMVALWVSAACGFTLPGGGLRGKCYELWFIAVGGGQQDQENVAIIKGTLDVQVGYQKCLNPGSGMFDVTPGQGGVVVQGYTTVDLAALEKWGKTTNTIKLPNTVPEFAELLFSSGLPEYADCNPADYGRYVDLYNACFEAWEAYRDVWGAATCRNKNWTDFAYLIEDTYAVGEGYRNCSPNPSLGWTPVGDYYCEYYDDNIVLHCTTTTPFAEPPFDFFCQEPPVAVDDAYITGKNTTLTRNAVNGVLSNDEDRDKYVIALTAILVQGPSNGRLTLNPDGSFTYKPNKGWTGTDTWTYKANDGFSDSYDPLTGLKYATVTITVSP